MAMIDLPENILAAEADRLAVEELRRTYGEQPPAELPVYAATSRQYSHDALIDVIVQNPTTTVSDLARQFGVTTAWMSIVTNSDAFRAKLKIRRDELIDPGLIADAECRLRAIASISAEVLIEKLHASRDPKLALRSLDVAARALGYGQRTAPQVAIQQNFVVEVPPKAESSAEWADKHRGEPLLAQGFAS